MNYSQSLQYLNSFLNLETLSFRPDNRIWNLKRMRLLLDLFDHPEHAFFPILIAGTKGKGSTGFFLNSILNRAGISAGFYNSPHLMDPRERILVGGQKISKAVWARELTVIYDRLKIFSMLPGMGQFTYFEICTLLAAMVFKRMELKVGIFEVGLGGRLDATNALEPKMMILTPIHFDHEDFLGYKLSQIANEKAAIIRGYADAVVAKQLPEAGRVIREKIKTERARGHFISRPYLGKVGLIGEYQNWNAALAVETVRVLKNQYGLNIPTKAVREGLKNGDWPGRFEKAGSKPDLILDVAHNPASAEAFTKALKKRYSRREATLIFAVSRDKKSAPMLKSLGTFFSRVIITRFQNPRACDITELLTQAKKQFDEIYTAPNSRSALKLAYRLSKGNDLVAACGSFYLIGEIKKYLNKSSSKKKAEN